MINSFLRTRLHGYLFAALIVATCGSGWIFACTSDTPGSTLGQPCSSSQPCGPDSVCDPKFQICVETKADGGTGGKDVSTADLPIPDAPVGTPDAPVGTPDAPVGTPDAPVGTPDSNVGTPDTSTADGFIDTITSGAG